MGRSIGSWILSLVLCGLSFEVASATVLLPADFETVVTGSPLIVHGRVVEVRSALTGPRRAIESVVTLSVIESLKGNPGATVAFKVPNGQVGRYRRILVGAPEFEAGDEVVVFLHARAPALPPLFGLSQGVYRVAGEGARRVVRGDGARGDRVRQPVAIDAFTRDVRAVMARVR